TFTSPIPPLTVPHSNPNSPDVSSIQGNVSAQSKRLVLDIMSYYLGAKEDSFGVQVGRRLQLRSMNSQTVFEVTVAKDMCNPFGTLHGACACYIVDPCSMSAIVVLGAALGIETTGVSQSMNLIWHKAAKIFIIDSETDRLYVSAIHSTIHTPDSGSRPRASKM
ncbi:hypothetical protein BDP27DRAFT_1347953, partial [Rhodocollybia butyracea]